MRRTNTHQLVLSGILTALVFVVTSFTMIKVPFAIVKEAYFHAGDSVIFLSASLMSIPFAAFISSIGSFFADLYLGSPQYMIATLLIKGIMGAIAGYFLNYDKDNSPFKKLSGLILAGSWMAISYYLYEVAILGINPIANLPSLLVNFAQAGVGIIIYLPLSKVILKRKIINKI